jgi:chromosome partitioning protein
MIVTVANHSAASGKTLVAENLALLRARSAHKVLLLDTDAKQACQRWSCDREQARLRPVITARAVRGCGFAGELERFQARFADIVIDTGWGDTPECRSALIAAQSVVVPLAPQQADVSRQYQLIARLNAARMFNPGLRVLFVIAGDESDPDLPEVAAIRSYAAQVMSSSLAKTVIHLPALRLGSDAPGRCACDLENSAGAAEMAALYQEVFRTPASVRRSRLDTLLGLDT